MSLWIHSLLLDQPKIRLFQVDEATIHVVEWPLKDIFGLLTCTKYAFGAVEKAMVYWSPSTGNTFSSPWWAQNETFLIRESDVKGLACHFELIFVFLIIPKYDLVYVEKALFLGRLWHIQLLFGLWTSSKCGFVEVKKATFLVVASHWELTFCLLTSPNCDLDEVRKAMIKISNFTLKSFSGPWPTKNATFFKAIKRRFKWSNCTFASWQAQNSTFVSSRKRCYKWSPGNGNIFYSSWPAQNASLVKSRKGCFKGSYVT